jgi:DNA gyrase inhibitor GyrI
MDKLVIRIVELEPLLAASFHAFGESPEIDAMQKLIAWAKPRGLLDTAGECHIFGFNNPNPSPGNPNYGYEYWIEVGIDIEQDKETTIKEFAGGLYAVARCVVKNDAYEIIPETWQRLVAWRESSKYGCGNHQYLEEHIGPFFGDVENFTLDLYLPISE